MADGRKHPDRPPDDDLAAAIDLHAGAVARVADQFGVPRTTVSDWIRKTPRLARLLADTREATLDEAEAALNKAAKGGQPWAVCFLLKTLGKKRGYVEKADLVTARAVFQFVGDVARAVHRQGLGDGDRAAILAAVQKAAAKRFPDVPKPK